MPSTRGGAAGRGEQLGSPKKCPVACPLPAVCSHGWGETGRVLADGLRLQWMASHRDCQLSLFSRIVYFGQWIFILTSNNTHNLSTCSTHLSHAS